LIKTWLLAARPKTLLLAVSPVGLGTALAYADHKMRWPAAFLALASAVGIQVGTNLFNDYADFMKGADSPERLGPLRVTAQGLLLPHQVLKAACGSFVFAMLCGLGLFYLAGWPVLAIGILSILCGFAYTGGPYPIAYVGLGEVFVLLFFGGVATCGTYYVHALQVSSASLLAGLALGLLATAVIVVNNLRDRFTDAQANKRTLAVRLGGTFARLEYTLVLFLAFCVSLFAVASGIGKISWLLSWLCLPYAVSLTYAIWEKEGAALNYYLGATAKLQFMFSALWMVGILL
jgi:1,4-dihydroxy-2-naphthoate polyprenyltransferase